MKYRVEMLNLATQDAHEFSHYIAEMESDAEPALKWLDGLEAAVMRLESFPKRHKIVSELATLDGEYRGFVYGSHRVIYRVDDNESMVYVLRIWHGARQDLLESDL